MKKLSFLILLILISSCNISCNSVSRESSQINNSHMQNLYTDTYSVNGMTYKVITLFSNGIAVVNITKDSLECEYYKKNLK
jgi:hypothetical protein